MVQWFVALALLVSADASVPPNPTDQRRSTVVVRVSDGGFHWADAGLGAAAGLATALLAVGLVLTLRSDRGEKPNLASALLSGKERR